MATMELTLSLVLVLLVCLIARLLLAAAQRKNQLARFQQLIELETEQDKVKAVTSALRRKNERMRNITESFTITPKHAALNMLHVSAFHNEENLNEKSHCNFRRFNRLGHGMDAVPRA